jgi:hypothetical protein
MNKMLYVMAAKPGKIREAVATVKALAEYVSSKYDIKTEVYIQSFGGTLGTIYAIAEYKDAATAQAAQAKAMADDGYVAIARTVDEVIVNPPTLAFLQLV